MVQWTHSLPPSLLGIKTFQTHTTPHNIAAANIMSKRETETYSWLLWLLIWHCCTDETVWTWPSPTTMRYCCVMYIILYKSSWQGYYTNEVTLVVLLSELLISRYALTPAEGNRLLRWPTTVWGKEERRQGYHSLGFCTLPGVSPHIHTMSPYKDCTSVWVVIQSLNQAVLNVVYGCMCVCVIGMAVAVIDMVIPLFFAKNVEDASVPFAWCGLFQS